METQPLIVERTLMAPVTAVWNAITEKDRMREWYFDIDEFKPEVGFKFQFVGKTEKGIEYLHLCEVKEVVPGKKLVYSWRYDGYKGDSLVTFELFDEGGKTRLKLTHTGLESFPDHPDFAVKNFTEGWKQIIGVNIKDFVEGKS